MKRNMLRRAAAALLLLALACSCVQAQGAVAWGSRGNDVSRVQSKLKQYGYYSGAVDGIFGQATYDAVIWFQKKNSLKADGVVGSATAAAVGAAGVSGLELAVGAVCRRVLHTAVWDYADEWGNLAGLVCPKYTAYWFLLCGWVIFVLRGVESTVYHPQKSASRH